MCYDAAIMNNLTEINVMVKLYKHLGWVHRQKYKPENWCPVILFFDSDMRLKQIITRARIVVLSLVGRGFPNMKDFISQKLSMDDAASDIM
jgi:hypothetical protein